jgi:hypothetical protein
MPTPPAGRHALNDADLRYLRGALLSLRAVHSASNEAADRASDPRVRAVAARAHSTQTDDIRAITSMLLGGDYEGVSEHPRTPRPVRRATAAGPDAATRDGIESDHRFIAELTAHAEESLVRVKTEMIQGFSASSRRHAQDTGQASWHQIAALGLLTSALDQDTACTQPAELIGADDS